MKRFLQGQTFTPAILQKRNIVNWGILSSLILVFLLSTTSSYANCYGNVNDSGEIGYDQSICAGESVTIENVELPSGGSGTLEYAWLFSTSGPSTDDVDVVTSSSSSFTTGELYETTWIRRCSRRAGCSSWNYGESNWVEISVENGNVSDGGVIAENQTICSGENVTISNVTLPSGGCGEIEYLWLTNTSGAYTNGCDTYASSSASYTFNDLTETTWIRRCSRREGHSSWNYGESNWVKITISSGNVEDGGTIGDNQTICSGDDVTINNVTLPTGGDCDDDIEYLWLSNTAGPDASSATTYASSSSSHTFSNLTETTWIRRCSRREGHSSWSYGESNWLKITVGPCIPNTCNDALVTWSLDACQAYEDAYSYDEFTPEYTSNSDCGTISASTVHRNNPNDYYHSCLVGHDGNAMCVSGTYVDYVPEHSVHRLLFSTTLNEGTTVSGLSFYQKSEEYISNIGSSSATHNNYLTKFSLRAKIDGTLIYESNNNSTSQNGWELSVFDFSSIAALNLSTTTTIDFELVAYDPIENGGSMRAWELDEIKILGCCAATTATIGDVVFNDVNGNGIHDNGETGLEGVIVMLLDADGNMVAQTTTNADGTYSFTDVAAGDYKLKFPATGILNGSTYALTIPNQGNDESVDSDPTVMTGTNDAMTPIFTVNGGDDITDISAGYYFVSTISGFAFEDNNGNGIQNLGDEGLNGITVMLLDENGNMVAQTVTTNGGNYQFENLAPGSYKVKFPENPNINGSTATLTIPNQGSDDNLDSDAVPMNNGSGNAMTQLVTVENGQTIDNLDAGYFTPISIGDKVFE
ncbi:MAG TPA: hypothetical protein ENK52_00755, partial [Saprospiraceae bacterium]|nr:hypothetical protein [Saprospiraceae bacterium]